jgi:hypothetical protein
MDLDPHYIEMLNPDPHLSYNSRTSEAENGAPDGRGRSQ